LRWTPTVVLQATVDMLIKWLVLTKVERLRRVDLRANPLDKVVVRDETVFIFVKVVEEVFKSRIRNLQTPMN
jgi:hypothetical protein